MAICSKEYLQSIFRKKEWLNINQVQIYCGIITKEQTLQDIKQLIYIINNRYCGKEYWENKGIEFSAC